MVLICSLIYFLCFACICGVVFLQYYFGDVTAEQVFFHLANPLAKANTRVFYQGCGWIFLPSLVATILVCFPSVFCPRKTKLYNRLKSYERFRWHGVIAFVLLCGTVYVCGHIIHFWDWIKDDKRPSIFYEKHFISANKAGIHFAQKRNVIIIYMESMENTYHHKKSFGEDLAPSLSKLEHDHVSFLNYEQIIGTDFTAAAIFSGFCGVPFSVPLRSDLSSWYNYFAPEITCIPTVFKENGYSTHFLMGSLPTVGNIGIFLKLAGIDDLIDLPELKARGLMNEKTEGSKWGMKDSALFDVAREQLLNVAAEGRPFFYGISTIDTHYPDPFFDEKKCIKKYDDFEDVIMCSDKIINEFVDWVKQQEFAQNTVIILVGDHLAARNPCIKRIVHPFYRRVINVFINAAVKPISTARSFTAMDWAPTILAASGAELKSEGFGLGRNLFSGEPTLFEAFRHGFKVQINRFRSFYRDMMLPERPVNAKSSISASDHKETSAKQE